MKNLLEDLNEQQKDAVTSTEGYIRVIAGAGSGKTKTLVHRYAYLVDGAGISPENILCVTFTNKAAEEMRGRIKKVLSDGVDGPYITTFHGFCVKVLREEIHHVNFPQNFTIIDEDDQKYLLQEVFDELDITINMMNFTEVFDKVSEMKRDFKYVTLLTAPGEVGELIEPYTLMDKVIHLYLKKQRKYFALDFDDLMNFVLYIFTYHKEILQKWQERLYYIQVDEYQDSSSRQVAFLDLLSAVHKNLFVVGDPDQAIYSWRGAKPEYLVNFDKKYENVKTIMLLENYRSTAQILNVGNELIKQNVIRINKDLYTKNSNGLKVTHHHAATEEKEIIYITNKIKELVTSGKAIYSDIAILYRAHFVSRFVEQGLISAGIPYTIFGGLKFYKRAEIKDALSYLQMITSDNDIAFLRTINNPIRNFGKSRIAILKEKAQEKKLSYYETLKQNINEPIFKTTKVKEYIQLIEHYRTVYKSMSNSDLLRELLEKSGYDERLRLAGDQDRIDNISELFATMVSVEKEQGEEFKLEEYLQSVALMTDKEKEKEHNKVKLMTIHTSKGLEFPYVFLVSFSDGIIPSFRSTTSLEDLEEERRLAYVAVTRAMKELYISDSEQGNGSSHRKLPSRFLFEVNDSFFTRIGQMSQQLIDELKAILQKQPKPHKIRIDEAESVIGREVEHPIFGTGIIHEDKGLIYLISFNNVIKPIQKSFKGLTIK